MRKLNAKHYFFVLLPAAALYSALLFSGVEPARSDPKETRVGYNDFGAETVEPLPAHYTEDAMPTPLPVDLVEERGKGPVSFLGEEVSPATADPADVTLAPPSGEDDSAAKMTTVLNVNDVELSALIKTFSKLTKRNYIIDSSVKGKVTILLPTAVTIEEALRIFDTVLLLKGFTTVPVEGNTWKVIPAKDAKQTTVPLVRGEPDQSTDAIITKLIRLSHIPAAEMEQLLNPFISRDGVIKAVTGSNALLIIDGASNIERLEALAEELDVPALDQEITIIPILHAEAADVAEKINQILGTDEQSQTGQGPNIPTNVRGRSGIVRRASLQQQQQQQPAAESAQRSLPLKIIPDERTNSLIVVADPGLTLRVRALAEQLDSEIDRSSGRFYVYRLKHADAEQLADIINSLISGAGSTSETAQTSRTSGSSISRSASSAAASRAQLTPQQQRLQALQRRQGLTQGAAGGEPGGRVTLEGDVSIAPDPATNSLIINAGRSDYQRIKEVIDELDIQRRQVLVEATLLEVTLNDEEGMGIELQGTAGFGDNGGIVGQTNFGGITNLLTNPAALTDLTIAAASSGTLTLPGGLTIPSQAVLISAVSRHSNVNVLSSPTILTTDNEEAEIIVGENVPFVASRQTDTTNLNATFNNIERQDVGITLRITPQISTGEFVTLKIFAEISNVVAGTRNDPNGPTTTIRTTETTVEVKNNQMIVTGGLIQDSVTDSTRGVPFIQDIPVIGQYFQRQDKMIRRTNLLVFITPRIVSDQYDAREQTKEYAEALEREILSTDAVPSREEVLRNPRIDHVVESIEPPAQVPTTISPPARPRPITPKGDAALKRTERRINNLLQDEEGMLQGDAPAVKAVPSRKAKQEVLDITVRPRLPSTNEELAPQRPTDSKGPAESSQPPAPRGDQSEAELLVPSGPPKSASLNGAARTYVVLRSTGLAAGESLPYSLADNQGTLGIVLLGAPGSPNSRFFEVGREYRYGKHSFVCLGVYGSPAEAKIVHQSLADESQWRSLTPQDNLLLGKKGWLPG